jgi:serine protease
MKLFGALRNQICLCIPCFLALLFWGAFAVGCGGGGGDGKSSRSASTISGHLIVPPAYDLESEPNNSPTQAQDLPVPSVISGSVSVGDPGFSVYAAGRPILLCDLYRLQAQARTALLLTIAEDDLSQNDLDLFLLNAQGSMIIDASEGYTSTEYLETPGPGVFLLGIRAFAGSSAYVLSASSSSILQGPSSMGIPPGADFVPGELLVKWKNGRKGSLGAGPGLYASLGVASGSVLPGGVEILKVLEVSHEHSSTRAAGKLSLEGASKGLARTLTLDRLRRMLREPQVEYAEPNFVRKPMRTPNDPGFSAQWHYGQINLPQAWDVTTGSDNVTIGLIDTGVLTGHPDLSSRLTAGFDFVSDPRRANDGDGIDPDPTDPGDDPEKQSSSFHGTHVAGTVGAVTDNRTGVAGVTWQGRLMPLRALGVDGGTDADIAQAIRYGAGLSNVSGKVPAQKADILNMSFGGPGYSQTLQDALSQARSRGVFLLAAAGNENSAVPSSPASLSGVLSVSAVDAGLRKASYSNFGSSVDLCAPGGDMGADLNGDGYPDGVLSTLGNDRGDYLYRFYQGTSMACAHASGVVALMRAVNPTLTAADLDLLLSGSHPGTSIRITRDLGQPGRDDFYGHGLIDAAQAVIAAQTLSGSGSGLPDGSILALSTSVLQFNTFLSSLSFQISNAGTGTLTVTNVSDTASWLSVTPSSGVAPLTVQAFVDRSGLRAGTYTATITVQTDATVGEKTAAVEVQAEVGDKISGNVGTVYVLVLNPDSYEPVAQAETDASTGYAFTTEAVPAGTYLILAGTDRDDDGFICDIEDACGSYPLPVTVRAGSTVSDLVFPLSELVSPQSLVLFRTLELGPSSRARIW